MSDHDRPDDARKICREVFDALARSRKFNDGPYVSSFGDGPGEPYVPHSQRTVWGRLKDGRAVWADGD